MDKRSSKQREDIETPSPSSYPQKRIKLIYFLNELSRNKLNVLKNGKRKMMEKPGE